MSWEKRGGFTILELVIVVAVIGLLTAVLIPVFEGLLEKAEVSRREQEVRRYNMCLAEEEIENGENMTVCEAIRELKQNGFSIGTGERGGAIAWDAEAQRFVVFEREKKEEKTEAEGELWVIAESTEMAESYGQYCNVYLHCAVREGETLRVGCGVDAGENKEAFEIRLENQTGNGRYWVRTNGQDLCVDAPEGSVIHEGTVRALTVLAVAANSYHECGTVMELQAFGSGRLVIEETAAFHQSFEEIRLVVDGVIENRASEDAFCQHHYADTGIYYDADGHTLTCMDCQRTQTLAHTFSKEAGRCTVCGYEQPQKERWIEVGRETEWKRALQGTADCRIRLTNDISLRGRVTIAGGRRVEIDLGGHELSLGRRLEVLSEGTLIFTGEGKLSGEIGTAEPIEMNGSFVAEGMTIRYSPTAETAVFVLDAPAVWFRGLQLEGENEETHFELRAGSFFDDVEAIDAMVLVCGGCFDFDPRDRKNLFLDAGSSLYNREGYWWVEEVRKNDRGNLQEK